jgi:hypothetical protein
VEGESKLNLKASGWTEENHKKSDRIAIFRMKSKPKVFQIQNRIANYLAMNFGHICGGTEKHSQYPCQDQNLANWCLRY